MSGLPTIALTMGDPAGVGPEIVVKALADEALAPMANWVVVGDAAVFRKMGVEVANLRDARALERGGGVRQVGRAMRGGGRGVCARSPRRCVCAARRTRW